jgi:hypothetical protein
MAKAKKTKKTGQGRSVPACRPGKTSPQSHSISTALVGETSSCFDLVHIRGRHIKHGGRGPHEWVQAAIGVLRAQGRFPPDLGKKWVVIRVRAQLRKDPAYRESGRKISRYTILSAWAEQRGIELTAEVLSIVAAQLKGR